VDILIRKFRTLFVLTLVVGVAAGSILAYRGAVVTLGPVFGKSITLSQPTAKAAAAVAQTAAAGASQTAGGTGAGQGRTGAGAAQAGFGAPSDQAGTAANSAQGGSAASSAPAASGAGFAQASAVSSGSQATGRPLSGAVQQVDGTTITLTTQSGALAKATVDGNTTYMKNASIIAGDIKAGDNVTIFGQTGADGSITAQQVTVGTAGPTFGAGSGARQSSSGNGQSGAGAGYAGGGRGGSAASGGTVTGSGSTGSAASNGGNANGQATGSPAISGAVLSTNGNTLTVAQQGGDTVTVTLNAQTRLRKPVPAALTDITAGAQVTIIGQAAADGSILASVVQISPAG
jgi:hypothetical protein